MLARTRHTLPRTTPAATTLGLSAGAVVFLLALGGCSRPLLSEKDQRSPFDRYDKARNQFAQQEVTDAYGRKTPNLDGRLSPKE